MSKKKDTPQTSSAPPDERRLYDIAEASLITYDSNWKELPVPKQKAEKVAAQLASQLAVVFAAKKTGLSGIQIADCVIKAFPAYDFVYLTREDVRKHAEKNAERWWMTRNDSE